MNKLYGYKDMKDKTIEGIRNETKNGLLTMAFYMYQTRGFPIENFNNEIKRRNFNLDQQTLMYLHFRNENPKLFNA